MVRRLDYRMLEVVLAKVKISARLGQMRNLSPNTRLKNYIAIQLLLYKAPNTQTQKEEGWRLTAQTKIK
ncbi:hypothetical protein ACTXT7_001214 [Hymenolepis weldensis]